MKKCLTFLLALVMVLAMAACDTKGPKTAADLLDLAATREDRGNLHSSGTVKMNLSMNAPGLSVEAPVDVTLDGDMADGAGHFIVNATGSALGQSLDVQCDVYWIEDEVYVGYGGKWIQCSLKDSGLNLTDAQERSDMALADLFKDAKMVYDRKAKTYTVTTKAAPSFETDVWQEYTSSIEDMYESAGMADLSEQMEKIVQDMSKALGDSDVTYVYDDTYHVRQFVFENMNYEMDIPESLELSGTISVSAEVEMTYDSYGQIDPDSVRVPDSVKECAVEYPMFGAQSDWMGDDADESVDLDNLPEPVTGPTPYDGTDILGAYKGVSLTPGFDATIFDGEFVLDPSYEDGDYSWVTWVTYKYQKDTWTTVHLYDYNQTGMRQMLSDGVFGYTMYVDPEASLDTLPDMSFGGLTWGATYDEVVERYRELFGAEPDLSDTTDSGSWFVLYSLEILDEIYSFEIDGYSNTGAYQVQLFHCV